MDDPFILPTVSATRNRLADLMTSIGQGAGKAVDWLAGGAQVGAEPTLALMRGDALDQPFLPTADSGGRIGAIASALGSTVMPVGAPAGSLGAGPVLRGLRGDAVDVGWHLRDVDRGALVGMPKPQTRALNAAIDAGNWTEETLPVRSIYGTQSTVNSDFAEAASRYVGDHPDDLPLVVKRDGKYYAQDGHHRLTAAAQEGQTARVRLIDLDGDAPDPRQTRLLSGAGVPSDQALLGGSVQPPQPADPATQAAQASWIQEHLARGGM